MKNLRIITLTAICMMAGVSLLEAKAGNADKHSIQFTNNTANPLSIECKSQYLKMVYQVYKKRHDKDTLTVAPGKSVTWKYHTASYGETFPKYIKIKDTVNGKRLDADQSKSPKILGQLKIDSGNNIINADYTITTISSSGTTVTTKINGDGTTTVTSTPKTGTPTVETKPSSNDDLVLK
ncbi:MAG: hypothetical protein Q8Q60_03325 [Candidatus Chromulinivorax sp.]|nr:hypothetical protein [Candidatus Chromulinivorax sp.]